MTSTRVLQTIICFHSLLIVTDGIPIDTPQYSLHQYLFTNYSTSIRPVLNYTTPTTVEFELSIYNLIDLNEKTQVMIVNAEMIMKWNDSFLYWDPDDFGGIYDIRVPWKDVWTPDVVLYNSADSAYEFAIYNTQAMVKASGQVTLLSHAILRSSCEINIRYYPFDQQVCVMSFSSWTQDITQIQLVTGPAEGDISAYVENPEFFLENFYVDGVNTTDACCETPFSTLRYYVQLQRRIEFSLFFFIMPGVFVNLTALMVFCLPCESGEKISLGISSMLAMMVFLMAMTDNLPPTQTIPIAGTYYGTCIGVLTANLGASVVILNIQYKGVWGFPVPNWIRVIMFDLIAKLLFVSVPPRIRKCQVAPKTAAAPSTVPESRGRPLTGRAVRDEAFMARASHRELEEIAARPRNQPFVVRILGPPNGPLESISSDKDVPGVARNPDVLERLESHMAAHRVQEESSELKSALAEEWRLVGFIMDRLCGLVFLLATITFNIVILTSSPEVMRYEYCRGPPGSCN